MRAQARSAMPLLPGGSLWKHRVAQKKQQGGAGFLRLLTAFAASFQKQGRVLSCAGPHHIVLASCGQLHLVGIDTVVHVRIHVHIHGHWDVPSRMLQA